MKKLIVIPARFASTRFPGKPLALLSGKPLIQWSYENAAKAAVCPVIVATDDQRIAELVRSFGGVAVMTSAHHVSGTDRAKEAMDKFMPDCEGLINLQGDEPFVPEALIKQIGEKLEKSSDEEIVTVAVRCGREEAADNPNIVKVVVGKDGKALYFSRCPIPFPRHRQNDPGMLRHWGIYAFRRRGLERFVSLRPSPLENCEGLEQLRALENDIPISVLITQYHGIGIDVPQDLAEAEIFLKKQEK